MTSLEEYLSTIYRPDCDFVDGQVVERNGGERDHSWTMGVVGAYLLAQYKGRGFFPFFSLRIRVKPSRVRVPDVCVTAGFPDEQILTKPPALCIEILSPEDRMTSVMQRIDDYLEMGVPMVWILAPETRHAYTVTSTEGLREIKNGVLQTKDRALEMPLSEVFP
jgi:Uma2 family endonuclease